MHKLYPWIPILGFFLVFTTRKSCGLDSFVVFWTAALWQAICTNFIFLGVLLCLQ